MYKLYFGRIPESIDTSFNIDEYFYQFLVEKEFNWGLAVDRLTQALDNVGGVYHTVNPLIVNYMSDELVKETVWVVDAHGREIKFSEDPALLAKLQWMGPGEALADDSRTG